MLSVSRLPARRSAGGLSHVWLSKDFTFCRCGFQHARQGDIPHPLGFGTRQILSKAWQS